MDMETTKTVIMEKELAERIQKMADLERRSFSRQAQVLLESALERQKQPETAEEAK
jgi:predicted transcriptional regulator